jgi:hypothetical protein
MLMHIVVWKYRREVDMVTRAEHVELLEDLTRLVPGMVSLRVGADVLRLPRSFDTGLVIEFQDREALEAYTVHPRHQKVVEFGRLISENVVSVDFED